MKFLKLSLAAIVAAGGLSSVASASALEEAIKNVDVSGFAFYRYQSNNLDGASGAGTAAKHQFRTVINFKSAIDDNFFTVLGFDFNSADTSGDSKNGGGITNVGATEIKGYSQTLNVKQALLGYQVGNTTVQVGRQVMGTFYTADSVGTGLKVLNSDVPGLTIAAVAFDAIEDNDGDMQSRNLADASGSKINQSNLYGLAAIGAYDPVSFQVWYATLDTVASLYTLDVGVDFDLGDLKLGGQAQYSHVAFNDGWKSSVGAADSDFWALQVKGAIAGFDGRIGYVDFSADDVSGNAGASIVSIEDRGSFISAGEAFTLGNTSSRKTDYSLFYGDNNYWFVAVGYKFLDKVRVGVDYLSGETTLSPTKATNDFDEWTLRASYDYSKKLKFVSFLSFLNIDDNNNAGVAGTDDTNFRFQATYNF